MRVIRLLMLAAILVAFAPAPASAETSAGTPLYFRETGHTLAYNFRLFFERQGGLAVFGLPLTEVFLEQGRPTQYFERARLEWHAHLGLVQAGLLGRWASERLAGHPAFEPVAAAPPGAVLFSQTGHSVGGEFLRFWQRSGGLATFGFPLSEEFAEANPQDGRVHTVQYFERARFELHLENPAGSQVLLGHLGRQYMEAFPPPAWADRPVARASQAWEALRPTRVQLPRIGVDTAVVPTGFSYGEWDVPRYTAAHYWPISGYPGTAGNIIIAGHVGYRGIIFNRLPKVQVGDELRLTVAGTDRVYTVREVLTVLPADTWVMSPTSEETVTLITCVPIGVYSHRLIVRATPAQSS